MNSIGNKDLDQSIYIFDSIIINGSSIVPIVSNLYMFFFIMLNSFYGNKINDYRINKTLQSKLPTFQKKYNIDEISNIIIELRNIYIISKSSSLDSKLLFHPFIIKVCKGYYGS